VIVPSLILDQLSVLSIVVVVVVVVATPRRLGLLCSLSHPVTLAKGTLRKAVIPMVDYHSF
jgi:hypothetical protein